MKALRALPTALRTRLDGLALWLAPLGLRLILAYEFGEAGLEKLRGENWFGGVQSNFPFPLNHVDPELSWWLATWAELGAAARFGLLNSNTSGRQSRPISVISRKSFW